jgi:hypothetical protein
MKKFLVFSLFLMPFLAQAKERKASSEARTETAAITGNVLDFDSANPLSSAKVIVVSEDNKVSKELETDQNGNFSLAGLPKGSYQLRIQKDGYETVSRTQALSEGASLKLGFMMLER